MKRCQAARVEKGDQKIFQLALPFTMTGSSMSHIFRGNAKSVAQRSNCLCFLQFWQSPERNTPYATSTKTTR